jgi:hypothetical protein
VAVKEIGQFDDRGTVHMMPRIYKVETSLACDHRLYAGGQWVNDIRQRCPECGVFTEDTEPPIIEIELSHLGKHGFAEYLWNSHSLPIFRQDLFQLWEKAELTGFDTKPVKITKWYEKPGESLPDNIPVYYRLVTQVKVRLNKPPPQRVCSTCGLVSYSFTKTSQIRSGFRIDPESWDGSDFCGLKHYVFLFCSQRVAELTLKAGYQRHLAFVLTENWGRWGEFNIRKWTPQKYREYVESFLIRRPEDL